MDDERRSSLFDELGVVGKAFASPRRLELRDHSATSESVRRTSRGVLDLGRDVIDQVEERRLGPAGRRRLDVQPVDVGEDHEQVGTDQVDDLGRQVVVVADSNLFSSDCIIFIYYR